MRVLFTGASSFTGSWFAAKLARRGHEVYCTFQSESPESYEGLRRERVAAILRFPNVRPIWGCSLASETLLERVREIPRVDVFCHHAAEVTDYKSLSFDALLAAGRNTRGVDRILEEVRKRECRALVLTGTYFEAGEGYDEEHSVAFSPYAVSKTLTWEILRYWARRAGMHAAKFVMPNPFGAGEERGLTKYLVDSWKKGAVPRVMTPSAVRDNIPVPVLARNYGQCVELAATASVPESRCIPSGYVGTTEGFVKLLGEKLGPILGRPCSFEVASPEQLTEPLRRTNGPLGHQPTWEPEEEPRFWRGMVDLPFGEAVF